MSVCMHVCRSVCERVCLPLCAYVNECRYVCASARVRIYVCMRVDVSV